MNKWLFIDYINIINLKNIKSIYVDYLTPSYDIILE